MSRTSTLLTHSGLTIDHVRVIDDSIVVVVTATRATVPCPGCSHLAHRMPSRYRRIVADLPAHRVAVHVELHTRRFRCDTPTCPRRIFAARFPSLVAAGARRSVRLSAVYLALGRALGREGGARRAGELGLAVSPDTLLRATLTAPHPHPARAGCR
jgi:hypothetical protein